MILPVVGQRVPLRPSGGEAVWNRQVQIVEDVTAAGLQVQINTFLTDLRNNTIYSLGASLLEIQFQRIGGSYTALLSFGYYSAT